jgi:NAD(P)-dependent dehydrogenase (short-subunit alcohol dehydrogenase family)
MIERLSGRGALVVVAPRGVGSGIAGTLAHAGAELLAATSRQGLTEAAL